MARAFGKNGRVLSCQKSVSGTADGSLSGRPFEMSLYRTKDLQELNVPKWAEMPQDPLRAVCTNVITTVAFRRKSQSNRAKKTLTSRRLDPIFTFFNKQTATITSQRYLVKSLKCTLRRKLAVHPS